MSVFNKEWLENNTLPITNFQQLQITKSLEVLLILVEFLILKGKLLNDSMIPINLLKYLLVKIVEKGLTK